MNAIKYRPEIDGLRAVAVLAVVIYHLGFTWLPGGFAGVDVFFVISGFLITSIILREETLKTFTFKNFWARRIKRIIPASIAMLLGVGLFSYLFQFGPEWEVLGKQMIAVIFFYANIEMWSMADNYWGPAAENALLLHTWSLSVEEQFYFFYPVLLVFLQRYCKRYTFAVVLVLAVFSFLLCLWGTYHHRSVAFYFLPTRAWEMAAGCLLAIYRFSQTSEANVTPTGVRNTTGAQWFTVLGMVTILGSYFLLESRGFPGYQALAPVLGTMLIIHFGDQQESVLQQVLSLKPVVYMGKLSYSLYLWHWPVIVFGKAFETQIPHTLLMLFSFVAMVALSMASYHFVECKTRKSKRTVKLALYGTIASVVVACGLMFMPYQYDFSNLSATKWLGPSYDVGAKKHKHQAKRAGVECAIKQDEQYSAFKEDGILKYHGGNSPEVVVLGSSHGSMWASTIDQICEELGVTVSFFCVNATPPLIEIPPIKKAARPSARFTSEQKLIFDNNRVEKIRSWKPKLIVFCHRWSGVSNLEDYRDLVELLGRQGTRVLFFEQPPEISIGILSGPAYVSRKSSSNQLGRISAKQQQAERVIESNEAVQQLVSGYDFCESLKTKHNYLTEDGFVVVANDRSVFYIDDDHLSESGAMRCKPDIKSAISRILER